MNWERISDRYYAARFWRTIGTPCMCYHRPWWLRHKSSCKSSRAALDKARAEGRLRPQPRPLPED